MLPVEMLPPVASRAKRKRAQKGNQVRTGPSSRDRFGGPFTRRDPAAEHDSAPLGILVVVIALPHGNPFPTTFSAHARRIELRS